MPLAVFQTRSIAGVLPKRKQSILSSLIEIIKQEGILVITFI